MASLELLLVQHVLVTLGVDFAFQRLLLLDESLRSRSAFIMGVVEVLDNRLSGLQALGIRNVVEPQQQIVWCRIDVLIHVSDQWRVPSGVAGAILHGTVHANTELVCTRPLTPAIVVLGCGVWSEMCVKDVRQRLDTKVAAVPFVCWP